MRNPDAYNYHLSARDVVWALVAFCLAWLVVGPWAGGLAQDWGASRDVAHGIRHLVSALGFGILLERLIFRPARRRRQAAAATHDRAAG